MSIKFNYKPPETNAGSLRTYVEFYKLQPTKGPEPGQVMEDTLHRCFAEIYNPSIKDMEIMKVTGSKEAVTLRIRDPGKEYIPTNKHFFKIQDYRYSEKIFNIIYAAPDLKNNKFIKIIGEYAS